jgi:hypothetical protein
MGLGLIAAVLAWVPLSDLSSAGGVVLVAATDFPDKPA